MTEDQNPLVRGILDTAEKRASQIIREAEETAGKIRRNAEIESAKKISEEEALRDERIRDIREKEESQKRGIERLRELRLMDSVSERVLRDTEKELLSMAGSGKLSAYLPSWIAEASAGVGKSEAVVSFSDSCPVTEEMLRKAEKLHEELTGDKVVLSLSEKRIREDGVVVTDIDGRISFRNTIRDRMKRFQREIRQIVQEENAR